MDNLREAHAAACKERDELKRELQTYKTVFNEDALLNLTARYLGTAPDRLRELTAAEIMSGSFLLRQSARAESFFPVRFR